MSSYLADLITARPRGNETARRRFTVRTSKKAIAPEIDQLRRAFDRTATQHSENVTAVEVSADRGCLLVAMETSASERRAVRECEEVFAAAWYDAFGERDSPHEWWLSDQGSPEPRGALRTA